jgi:signal transduction histidine kinase
LPAGEEELLFEPFRRGTGRSRGSGLGLAIVRAVAEAHGGRAGVDNRPPEGATFWMTIPSRQDSADALWPSGSSR